MTQQTGRTTLQIRMSPLGARYLWVSNRFFYPHAIAMLEGRGDLRFVGPSWLLSEAWRGERVTDVVIDHAWEMRTIGRPLREALTAFQRTRQQQRDVPIQTGIWDVPIQTGI